MNGNSTGKALVLTCFGESHGTLIGAVIDGCPSGLPISEDDIQFELNRRRPGLNIISTPRKELDQAEILSGVYKGYTTGAPICLVIKNRDVDSAVYEQLKNKPRPGHADYTAHIKYGGYNDFRGGGRFSGRITAAYVMAGAIAKKLLQETIGVEILAHVVQIGSIKVNDKITFDMIRKNVYLNNTRCAITRVAKLMEREIIQARKDKDSIGGIIEVIALNVPAGLGEPIFDSLDSEIAKIMLNIPAVKGVEFGKGFKTVSMKGSQNNDQYILSGGRIMTQTNNSGGILGGISNGMPIVIRIAFKPTPSISKKQKTVNLQKMKETEIEFKGRHDSCVVPRAVPVTESCLALVLADHAIRADKIPKIIGKCK